MKIYITGIRAAKNPRGENSSRRKLRPANISNGKNSYGEISYSEKPTGEKSLRRGNCAPCGLVRHQNVFFFNLGFIKPIFYQT